MSLLLLSCKSISSSNGVFPVRFGSAVRVSVRVAAAAAVAAALEDLIKGNRDWDWESRKDAAFERRILFFLRGEGLDFLW